MSLAGGSAVVVGIGCVLVWALLATSLVRRAPAASRFRAAGAATILVAPVFVVVETWALAFAVGTTWPSLPWVIAFAGAIAFAIAVPLMATQTPRLTSDTRRRAVTNVAVIIVVCTIVAETFVFKDAPWSRFVFALVALAGVFIQLYERRKTRAG
jgi:hypothetical protein